TRSALGLWPSESASVRRSDRVVADVMSPPPAWPGDGPAVGRWWTDQARIRFPGTYLYNGGCARNVPGHEITATRRVGIPRQRGPGVSTSTVNGPSLTEWTCIIAPNTPVNTS